MRLSISIVLGLTLFRRLSHAGHSSFQLEDTTQYKRSDWRHWIDEYRDCQDTRHEILISQADGNIDYKTRRQCKVKAGLWLGPYSAEVFYSPSDLDVDHVVPLKHAHISGGADWSKEKKRKFANDMGNLLAVKARQNRKKGSRDPSKWMPPNQNFWCNYINIWVSIKNKYGLRYSKAEVLKIESVQQQCH